MLHFWLLSFRSVSILISILMQKSHLQWCRLIRHYIMGVAHAQPQHMKAFTLEKYFHTVFLTHVNTLTLWGSWTREIMTSLHQTRICLFKLQVMSSCPNHQCSGSISVLWRFSRDHTNPAALQGKIVIDRWCIQLIFESACPFPNSLQGRLLRWFSIINYQIIHTQYKGWVSVQNKSIPSTKMSPIKWYL